MLPAQRPVTGRPLRDHRQVVEGIIYRYRYRYRYRWGIAWRDLPEVFGPWQTVWKRHRRFAQDGTWDRVLQALIADADAAGEVDWTVSVDSTINRAHQHAATLARTTGAPSNYTNLRCEPADHAIGRSRGGLSTKIHHLVNGRGRPLVVLLSPGQSGDSPMFPYLLAALRVERVRGRPRTRPDAVLADKAYSSRGHRQLLRDRGITAVISEPTDQAGHRKRRGVRGGRPPAFDRDLYRRRNVVERSFNTVKHGRGLATRFEKLAIVYRAAAVLNAIIARLRPFRDTP